MQNNFIYLISDQFNYGLTICDDVGPGYCYTMGWKFDFISKIGEYSGTVKIIDPRITEEESIHLYSFLKKSNDIFLLTIIDPYQYPCLHSPYVQMIKMAASQKNTFLISRYIPEEYVLELASLYGEQRTLVLYYPYVSERETNIEFSKRSHRLIFSGNISAEQYPERYQYWKTMTRSPLRPFVNILPHAGYVDVGQTRKHNLIRENYIDHLSRFKFMFVSGSRLNLEFLKYVECGYAGCVPFGNLPNSFPSEFKDYFVQADFKHPNLSTIKLLIGNSRDYNEMAVGYRELIRKIRNPEKLNGRLLEFIDSIST